MVLPRVPELLMATGGGDSLGVESLEVSVESVELRGVSTEGATLRLGLRVSNPNSFDAVVDRVNYRIYSEDGTLVADGTTRSSYTVPAEGSTTIRTTSDVSWRGGLEGLEDKVSGWLTGEPPIWEIRGEVLVEVGPAAVEVPFSSEFEA